MSAKVSNAIVPASVVAVLLSSAAAADEASVRQSMQTKYPGKAYTDMMLNGKTPRIGAGACDTPIERILAFGRQKGISVADAVFRRRTPRGGRDSRGSAHQDPR